MKTNGLTNGHIINADAKIEKMFDYIINRLDSIETTVFDIRDSFRTEIDEINVKLEARV